MSARKWQGLAALVRDAVEHGSRSIERIQLQGARRTFDFLRTIPGLDSPTRAVDTIHRASVKWTHGAVRIVNRGAQATVRVALDIVDKSGR